MHELWHVVIKFSIISRFTYALLIGGDSTLSLLLNKIKHVSKHECCWNFQIYQFITYIKNVKDSSNWKFLFALWRLYWKWWITKGYSRSGSTKQYVVRRFPSLDQACLGKVKQHDKHIIYLTEVTYVVITHLYSTQYGLWTCITIIIICLLSHFFLQR